MTLSASVARESVEPRWLQLRSAESTVAQGYCGEKKVTLWSTKFAPNNTNKMKPAAFIFYIYILKYPKSIGDSFLCLLGGNILFSGTCGAAQKVHLPCSLLLNAWFGSPSENCLHHTHVHAQTNAHSYTTTKLHKRETSDRADAGGTPLEVYVWWILWRGCWSLRGAATWACSCRTASVGGA